MMEVEVLSPTDECWSSFLESVDHDVYHLPGYVGTDAHRIGGEPLALLVEESGSALMLPLILRPLPCDIDGTDAVSPYGYPGPLLSENALRDEGFVDAAGAAVRDTLKEMHCCSAFVRGHPLLPTADTLFEGMGRLRPLGPTVWIDLGLCEQERFAQMNRNCRRSIKRTRLNGYVASVDDAWDRFGVFETLYGETMDRAGAAGSYYFSHPFFEELRDSLFGHVHLLTVERDGEVVAAGLFLEEGGTVQTHLSGSKRLDGELSADRLMIDYAASWFAERGNRVLHLGGGLGAEMDSIFRFKSGFSPLRGHFRVWNVVTDQELFNEACSATGCPVQSETEPDAGFFPPYRHP